MLADALYLLAAIVGMAVTTVLTRNGFLLLPPHWQLPASVQAPLKYAPIAAIAAIIAPDVLNPAQISAQFASEQYLAMVANPKLWGALIGGVIYARSRNMGAAIGLGMVVFWGLRAWVGG